VTIAAVGLTVFKIDRGQRSAGSGRSEIDYNSLKWNLGLGLYTLLNLNVF